MIEIKNLKGNMEDLERVSKWLYSEWGNNNPHYWESWVKYSNKESDIPQTWGIYVNHELAGTYSLWRCDLQSRQDLTPWFGGLYVSEKFRGKEIEGKKLGERMILHAIYQLKALGFKKAYLFTERTPNYYMRYGWEQLCSTYDENDNVVTICRIAL